ncbi:hypothetical protein ACFY0G_02110 [Streptomyces sp. NPDC001552]|uniref:hypothetical protein n=1 Tax=Streptomyces sp. NPDC001552 TaxID=3364587 RepID=UPI003699748B
MDSTPQDTPQEVEVPRIATGPLPPGWRYRSEVRFRDTSVTICGETRTVPQSYTVLVPVPPSNWQDTGRDLFVTSAVAAAGFAAVWFLATLSRFCHQFGVPFAPVLLGTFAAAELAWRSYRRRTGRSK